MKWKNEVQWQISGLTFLFPVSCPSTCLHSSSCVLVCVGGSGPSQWFCVDVLVAVMQISIRDLLMNANEALAVDGNKDLSPTPSSFISLVIQSQSRLKRSLAPTSRRPGTHFYISKAGRVAFDELRSHRTLGSQVSGRAAAATASAVLGSQHAGSRQLASAPQSPSITAPSAGADWLLTGKESAAYLDELAPTGRPAGVCGHEHRCTFLLPCFGNDCGDI